MASEVSETTVSLKNAAIYVYAEGDPATWGRWFLLPDGRVVYQRPSGELEVAPGNRTPGFMPRVRGLDDSLCGFRGVFGSR
ncbi:hypothetical protein, partial [Amycolatopsis minnesotensis]|uniref:hypothetical protein n=1 Tax=Amycolatopsis minnesotensis TaxID=337894 RepID=UPI0031DD1FFE